MHHRRYPIRTGPIAPFALSLLMVSITPAGQDGPDPEAPPLPDGHFRVVSVETASTHSISVIEAVIEAPVGKVFSVQIENPEGTHVRSQSRFSGNPDEEKATIRIFAKIDAFGTGIDRLGGRLGRPGDGRLQPPGLNSHGMFSVYTRGSHGGGGGGGSFVIPRDRPFSELLDPLLEPGDHEFGEAVQAFRFQDDLYTIHVTEPGDAPEPPKIEPPRQLEIPRFGE